MTIRLVNALRDTLLLMGIVFEFRRIAPLFFSCDIYNTFVAISIIKSGLLTLFKNNKDIYTYFALEAIRHRISNFHAAIFLMRLLL